MTPTPLFAETPRPARRVALLLAHSSLALVVATALCVVDQAPVALILSLPLLALICLAMAIEFDQRTRAELAESPAHAAAARGLLELELYANRGSTT